ncbi:Rne/Rng family ribonuclease [Pannus brasiliensis CCIBt3594]|uniref:Rne/Rng family ribonuclease n=1 Tax=Pannus brasiliensis CCIBt3594 TaxID=1427578 RepID=A0AAW9QU57_9CHRO
MPKQIIIAEQHHIAAVFWEDQIQELVVATGNQQVGDTYLGLVENVIPGIDAAFVNIGDAERNGFIHVTDLGPLKLKKTAGAITELLAPQQKVLVQVMKEPTGNKGPRLTGNITLPGRYLVLMPYGRGVNLSRRIRSEDERSRLRALAILIKPAGMGLLVRTEAEGKAEEAIIEDLESLQKQWENIQQTALSTRAPALLNRDDDFIQRVLRDMYNADVNRIVVDSPNAVKRVKQQLTNWSGGKAPEGVYIDFHREPQPILDYFRVNAAVREALKPRVDLPSGGYIIIEPTEALTVIDVNSGSFTRSATARETVLWTNSEAATEIARQLRLRNIGGVIVVDFIDMDSRRDQLKLLELFNKALKTDKARPQIAQLSELGLVELTRKRQGKNIYELFGKPCPSCGGLGHLAHLPGEGGAIALETATVSRGERESFVSSPPRVLPDKAPPPEPYQDVFPEFDTEEGDRSLDLDFHPNYQEQGGNSRRRRRRRPSELLLKEDRQERAAANGTSIEPDAESETPTRFEERRERPSRPSRRGEEAPAPKVIDRERERERVSVEMTPTEQEVYSLMGISPLVLVDKEIKDPKAVVVSVKLPGEEDSEETTPPPIENAEASVTPEPATEESETGRPVVRRRRRISLPENAPPVVEEITVQPTAEPETVPPVAETIETNETGEEPEEENVVRRRRRRSSASSS